jgi:endoglucanase
MFGWLRRGLPALAAGLVLSWSAAALALPALQVDGNRILGPAGNTVTLRGVSVLAPEHNAECHGCGSRPIPTVIGQTANAADGWYSRVVRIPITTKYAKDPAVSFAKYIQPNVEAAIANNLYVIIDLHFVADYGGSRGITQAYVKSFWDYVAPKYANHPNVIFELFNEPINPDDWQTWKAFIQPVVSSIRGQGIDNLILMGGPQWSTRVNEAAADPIEGGNIAYVYHIYPNQGPASAANLDARFGAAAQKIPVIITEFGWGPRGKYSGGVAIGTTSEWGAPFRDYMDARPHISWVGWIFDTFWKPMYFTPDWQLLGGEYQGQFMKDWLFQKKDSDQP